MTEATMYDTVQKNNMLEIALAAHEAGLCVLPPKEDGSKRPFKPWEQYANTSSTVAEITEWYKQGRTGLGIVPGVSSRNLECFEFDDMDAYEEFVYLCEQAGLGELVRRIEAGYLEKSPNGVHWLYRAPEIAGNTKLAQRPKQEHEKLSPRDNVKAMIETRGQGGYVIIAPSHGGVHPSGKSYDLVSGGFDTIVTLTTEEHEAIWETARSLNRTSAQTKTTVPVSDRAQEPSSGGLQTDRPGDWFNRNITWVEVLEPCGWTWVQDQGVESFWRRPGKDRDHSATTNYEGTDVLKVFSSSTDFDPERSYTKFAAYAVLSHGSDYKAAARAVAKMMPKEERHLLAVPHLQSVGVGPDRDDSVLLADRPPSDAAGPGSAERAEDDVEDTWMRVDISPVLNGEVSPVIPTIMERKDGARLVYPGRIHDFKGAPSAGKGWFALLACKQEMEAGNNVVYIDFEDNSAGVVGRLIAMQCDRDMLEERFIYFNPAEAFPKEKQIRLIRYLKDFAPSLCVIDSVAEMMQSNRLNSNDNADAAEFFIMAPRPLARAGMAVIVIDHVTKAADNTRYGVGAQHKLAAISGSSFVVESESLMGVGKRGTSRISLAKDRLGRVAQHVAGEKDMGRLVVHTNDDGSYTLVEFEQPLSQTIDGMEQSAELMSEVAAYIESQGKRSPFAKEIRDAVPGRFEAIAMALDLLVSSGYLMKEKAGRGGGYAYTSIKPYEA